jgi:UV excision repair protein RAD23
MIAQHPEALYELLGGGDMGDDDEEYPGGAGGNQVMQVDLSPDEVAAVERVS